MTNVGLAPSSNTKKKVTRTLLKKSFTFGIFQQSTLDRALTYHIMIGTTFSTRFKVQDISLDVESCDSGIKPNVRPHFKLIDRKKI